MFDFLSTLLYGDRAPARVNSEEQLRQAQSRTYSQEVEREARAKGFNSAREYMAWLEQSRNKVGGTVPQRARPSVESATAAHPTNIFNRISEALMSANNRD